MIVDALFGVVHAVFPLKIVVFREVLGTWVRNLCPMLVLTVLLNGGLYRSMLLRYLFFFSFLSRGCFVVYGVPVYAFVECSSVWRADAFNDALSDELSVKCRSNDGRVSVAYRSFIDHV